MREVIRACRVVGLVYCPLPYLQAPEGCVPDSVIGGGLRRQHTRDAQYGGRREERRSRELYQRRDVAHVVKPAMNQHSEWLLECLYSLRTGPTA